MLHLTDILTWWKQKALNLAHSMDCFKLPRITPFNKKNVIQSSNMTKAQRHYQPDVIHFSIHLYTHSSRIIIICPIAIAQQGQIIKSTLSSVCVCVCVRAVAIFNRFWRNLVQTSGTWNERTLSLRSKSNKGIAYFYPILLQIGTYTMHFQWETRNTYVISSVDRL